MSDHGLVDYRVEDRIARVTLNRPDSLNAISGTMADELAEVFWHVRHDDGIWVMVLAAAGDKAFCVGADLKERGGFALYDFYRNREQIRGMFAALRKVSQPTVAAVHGFALGGGFELALSCDLIVASDDAVFGLPETRVGLLPAGGGTQLLTRRVGIGRAKELIFRGRRIDVIEAQELGIVADVTNKDALHDHALEVARDICRSSPVAVREAKRSIDLALGPVEQGIEVENDSWRRVIASDDRAEGIRAFNEKRDPEWRNR